MGSYLGVSPNWERVNVMLTLQCCDPLPWIIPMIGGVQRQYTRLVDFDSYSYLADGRVCENKE